MYITFIKIENFQGDIKVCVLNFMLLLHQHISIGQRTINLCNTYKIIITKLPIMLIKDLIKYTQSLLAHK